ncbi:hypothetical protein XO27_0041 [Bacillus phage phi4I1]|uniref:Uncharacterized protein n=2 Tax=Camtrevirus BtCS33 TaxID=2843759 RepID=A0A2I6UF45_9CAUD|nr:hypothetical protein XO27_0041 [Bacillus phage phi4I1]AUO78603.1 hypothetical protein XO27_0041 [Bacillus phage BtiUFT6.51-F]
MLRTRCKKRPVIAGQKSGYFVKEYNLFIILTGKSEK